ncbi:MAG: Nif11-like leader peptide family RiPP precursor [Clostridiales bacterium]|nr:Nif11-like leader peptide family RiPP precursor [Clostridiales bacterium]MCF8022347.1 Nif11-like leader peptide family RiPP precursor [Clostridiales bacterium]
MEKKVEQLLEKLKADGELAKKLFSQDTAEGAQAVLKEKGFDLSVDEITKLKDTITKELEKGAEGELSDDALENVAGGHSVNIDINW